MSFVDYSQRGLAEAEATLDQAVALAEALGNGELLALCHSQRANLLGQSGQLDRAMELSGRALATLEEMSPRDQCALLIGRGTIASLLMNLSVAKVAFTQAERIAEDAGLDRQAFMARHNLGFSSYLQGDLPEALRLMRGADKMSVNVSRGVARLDLGRVLLEAGLVDDALDVLEAGLVESVGDEQHQVAAELEMELARAHLLRGAPETAAEYATSAGDSFTQRGADVWAARCHMLLLEIRADTDASADVATAAIDLATADVASVDHALARDARLLAAEVLAASDNPDAADDQIRMLGALPPGIADSAPLSVRLKHQHVLAKMAASRSQFVTARQIIEQAAADLLSSQVMTGSLDLRTAVVRHGARLAQLDLRLGRTRSPKDVLAASERWRAVSSRILPVRPTTDPDLADALASLRRHESRVRDAAASEIDGLVIEGVHIREEIVQLARLTMRPDDGTHATAEITSMSEIRHALDHLGADLVSFIDHEEEVLAVVVLGGRLQVKVLGPRAEITAQSRRVRADLSVAASHDLGPLHAAVWNSLRQGLSDLDRVLLTHFKRRRDRLVVVPSASTQALPWSLLPSVAGSPITVAPSVTRLVRGSSTGSVPKSPKVIAIAGPGLDNAASEVQSVKSAWGGGAVLTGSAATADALREALGGCDLVHVAAHGTHRRQNPMFSSVRMADGSFYVHDLEVSGVHAAHVVLSACDVGEATVRPGEEALGLAAGLLSLGVRCVVAAVCRVSDDVAETTMKSYHHHLSRGRPADVALAMATNDAPELSGAFQVFGSPIQALTVA